MAFLYYYPLLFSRRRPDRKSADNRGGERPWNSPSGERDRRRGSNSDATKYSAASNYLATLLIPLYRAARPDYRLDIELATCYDQVAGVKRRYVPPRPRALLFLNEPRHIRWVFYRDGSGQVDRSGTGWFNVIGRGSDSLQPSRTPRGKVRNVTSPVFCFGARLLPP